MSTHTLFVSCPRGLEPVLAEELNQLSAQIISIENGGIKCSGSLETVYRINLYSRIAGRVLHQIAHQTFQDEADIYRLATQITWLDWFDCNQTFRIHIDGKHAAVKSLTFTALTVKDAVCDVFRKHTNQRPNVDKVNPDVRIHVFIQNKTITFFIDTSGEALFKRGYRTDTGAAPLRENLAAGLLMLAGFPNYLGLLDPFCGSGTIVIEAAMIATNQAPGLNRHFAFEQLKSFDATLWNQLKKEAKNQIIPPKIRLSGSDTQTALIHIAQKNSHAAGVGDWIEWTVQDALSTRPNTPSGLIMSNPPYGVRLSEIQALQALYPQIGSWLKKYFAGWTVGLLTGDKTMPKYMRLSPKRKIPLFNGNLDCRLYLLDMVAGSNR